MLFPVIAIAAFGAVPHTTERTVTQIADGVYVIIHKDVSDSWPEGNTTVIIGDRGVFVVDACFLTASAKEDIAEIRRLTPKPVRYLLNTHWHIDHNAGNSAYVEAFPGVEIVSQSATKRIMSGKNRGVAENWAAPDGLLAKEIAGLKSTQAGGKGDFGKPFTDQEKAELVQQIADRQVQMADYKTYRFATPTLTFERSLTLDLGNRIVEIRNNGRATTDGDAFVYLPKQKILVTGDIVVSPLPYTGGSFPSEWRNTLRMMAAMDFAALVPGHGPIERDKTYLHELIALLDSVISQVGERVTKMRSMAIAQF
ncbi:MAG: MBL fold metallo-hydrolase, partial [Bryobacteraceae bacterium]